MGLTAGTVELAVNGHSCEGAPAVTQTDDRTSGSFSIRPKPGTAAALPSPECKSGYLFTGGAKLQDVGYENPYVWLRDVSGGAQLHITPSELLLTSMSGYLQGGGSATGELRIVDWLGAAPGCNDAGA